MLDLVWEAPPSCPDRGQVVAHVEELVGHGPAAQKPLHAEGRVSSEGNPPRFVLQLVIGDDARAVRTLSNDDCARLADAAALILALDIEALGAQPEMPPSPPPPPAHPEPLPTPFAPPPPRARTLDAFLGARAVIDAGSLPRTTVGIGGALEIAHGLWAAELGGTVYATQFTVGGPRNGAGGAYVDLTAFDAFGCFHDRTWSVDLRGCLGGELGREATRGVSIMQPGKSASTVGALMAMARVRFLPKLPVSPTAGVVLGYPINPPRIVIETYGTVFEPAKLFFRGFLGLEAQFL